MSEKLPNLVEKIDLHRQKAHWTTNRRNIKKTTPTCLIIKLLKAKIKGKQEWCQRTKMNCIKNKKIITNFTSETMKARRHWNIWNDKEKTVSQELYIEENYNSKLKIK